MIGIYKITNTQTNKFYIGSSIDIPKRFKQHKYLLKNNIHSSSKLQNSVNKYGLEKFKFEIIEICDYNILKNKEQYYLDTLKPYDIGYNIQKYAVISTVKRTSSKYINILILDNFKNIITNYNNLKEVADNYNISTERVRQIIKLKEYSKKLNCYIAIENNLEFLKLPKINKLELRKLKRKSMLAVKLLWMEYNKDKISNYYLKKLTLTNKQNNKIEIQVSEKKRLKLLYNQLVSRKQKEKLGVE